MRRAGAYAASLALVAAAYAVAHATRPALGGTGVAMVFLLSVLVAAVGFGLGPALLAALAAAASYNFFFIEPRFTLRIGHPDDVLTFLVFFIVALATGWLAGRVRDQARATARRAAGAESLLDASRALSAAATADETAQVLARQAAAVTGRAAMVLLPAGEGMRLAGGPPGLDALSRASAETARRVWEGGAAADGSEWRFEPLDGLHGRVGVIGLRAGGAEDDPEDSARLAALLHQGAVALERAGLAAAAAENEALRRADELRTALLDSVSHDFRTPLSTVLGSATTLLDYEAELEPSVRRDLLESIREDAQALNHLVGDLLDMGRLEGGALQPRREWTDVREVLASAVGRIGDRLAGRRIARDLAGPLPLVELDPVLLEQAVLNLLDNAAAHAPDDGVITISAFADADEVLIRVEDDGPGVPPDSLRRIFDKFTRLDGAGGRRKGAGLGLSIARGFVEAMGGRITAESPAAGGRGARFTIALPKPAAPSESES